MIRRHARAVALVLTLAMLPMLFGCAGTPAGIVELALTAKKLYGLWQLFKLFDDGNPTAIQVAAALFRFNRDFSYEVTHLDDNDDPVATETGTWSVDNGVLVLDVEKSTIDPDSEGKTLRLPGYFEGEDADILKLTRRVKKGQVTVSQEQIYRRQPD